MRTLAIFAASYSLAVLAAVYGGLDRFLPVLGCVCILLCAAAVYAVRRCSGKGKRAAVCAAGLAVGFLWCFGYQTLFLLPVRALDNQTVWLEGQVIQFPQKGERGYSVLVRADMPKGGKSDVLLYVDNQGEHLRPGDRIGSVVRCRYADKTFSGEEITYYTAKGVFLRGVAHGTLTIQQTERPPLACWPTYICKALEESMQAAFSEDEGAVVVAIVTGNRDDVSQAFSSSLQRTGLSHTAAVSGMHLSFLAAFFTCILGKYRRRTALIVMPASVLLMLVAGCTPSVVRATIMILLLLAAPLFERERDDVTALGAALLVLLLQNPYAAANIGLQLSFGAVAGIFLAAEPIQNWMEKCLHIPKGRKRGMQQILWVVPNYLIASVSATLGASVFTVPLCAFHFSNVSLLSPLSNFLTLWAVALLFCGGLAVGLLGLVLPGGAAVLAMAVAPFAQYMEWVVRILARIPFAGITMSSFSYKMWTILLSFAILFILVRRSAKAAAAAGMLSAVTLVMAIGFTMLEFYISPVSVTALDTGQGQCVLIRQGKHLSLVDCGGDTFENAGDLAADYIQNAGRSRIDLLVLTHFHEDHANGAVQLLERLAVEKIAMPKAEANTPLGQEIYAQAQRWGTQCVFVEEDTTLKLEDGGHITLIAPLGDAEENERGLTVLATSGTFDVLLTGDMGSEMERELLKHMKLPDIELLVAGHHGSKYSTSQELLEAVRPEVVLISVGRENDYGHPAPETLERLRGTQLHRTDLEGTVTVNVSRQGI